jgi:hypothetical protein
MAAAERKVSRAVFAGRTPEVAPEKSAERSDAFEADFQTNVGDALFAPLQEPLCGSQTLSLKVLVRCFAKNLVKQAMKVVRGKASLVGNFVQVDLLPGE